MISRSVSSGLVSTATSSSGLPSINQQVGAGARRNGADPAGQPSSSARRRGGRAHDVGGRLHLARTANS